MPRNGVSTEWLDDRLDEMAGLLRCKNVHLLWFRNFLTDLYQSGNIDEALYRDGMNRCDEMAETLMDAQKWHRWIMKWPPKI